MMETSILSPYPFPRWHRYQGATNDCGPVSAAIVINTLRGEARAEPSALDHLLRQWRGWRPPGRIPRWATFPWGMCSLFRRYGLRARWRILADEKRLRLDLREGVAVIVLVGEPWHFERLRWRGWTHYKVLYGWEAGHWLFVDPAAPVPLVREDAATFTRRWRKTGRQLIEIWPPAVPEEL